MRSRVLFYLAVVPALAAVYFAAAKVGFRMASLAAVRRDLAGLVAGGRRGRPGGRAGAADLGKWAARALAAWPAHRGRGLVAGPGRRQPDRLCRPLSLADRDPPAGICHLPLRHL